MKFKILPLLLIAIAVTVTAQETSNQTVIPGFENRIRNYVDSLRIVDTHEHLFTPDILKGSNFLDFMMLFQQNGYDDLVSAGMPDTLFDKLFNEPLAPGEKWNLIEPYWNNSFNTSFSRVILQGIRQLYGIEGLNEYTVSAVSEKIQKAYSTDWFDRLLRDSCNIDYIIQDGYYMPGRDDYFRYAKRFDDWITVTYRYRIDSLAIQQLDPIYTLADYVKSLRTAFEEEAGKGMTAVKIFLAYSRPLSFEKVQPEAASKVFRSVVNSEETHIFSFMEVKPLQDYMLFRLLDLAREFNMPVAIHTGLQAGGDHNIEDSDPSLMINLFKEYHDVNFIIYHGSYPFGGQLSAIAKNYSNVSIDMNWLYSISPSYSERYLNEWIETVPVSKLMAFGGDAMIAENVYSELISAKRIITNVLVSKVKSGYLTEPEAKQIAKMILYDNAVRLYRLK